MGGSEKVQKIVDLIQCNYIDRIYYDIKLCLICHCTQVEGSSQISGFHVTNHSAYDATSSESNEVKIDGFLYPNFDLG